MGEIDFSVFTPTRGRPNQLVALINSFWANAKNPQRIEYLFWIDDDDAETISCWEDYLSRLPINIRAFIKPRPDSLNAAISFLALQARGRYLFNCNDDAVITTPDWDEIAINAINQYKAGNKIADDIIYCATNDDSVDRDASKEYSSFPIISKQAVDVLGFFMYPVFVGLGGDSSIYRLYKEAGRVVDLREINFHHAGHSTIERVMAPDKTAQEMRANTYRNNIDPYTFDVSKEALILKDFIAGRG